MYSLVISFCRTVKRETLFCLLHAFKESDTYSLQQTGGYYFASRSQHIVIKKHVSPCSQDVMPPLNAEMKSWAVFVQEGSLQMEMNMAQLQN